MSGRALALEEAPTPPPALRLAALAAVGLARVLAVVPPVKLRRVLALVRRGARAATAAEASRARHAVVAVSLACAGPRCLQRSIATVLLCRLMGGVPQWCTGVRTRPFLAHAWVAVDGEPVGEDPHEIRFFQVTMTVPQGGSTW